MSRAGEPSGDREEPPPEGLGGHHLLAQTDARCPAGQVMRHHLDRQPGGVGGETARLRDLRSLDILEPEVVGKFLHEVQLLGADRLAAQDLQVVRDLGDFVLACGPDGIAQVASSQAPDPEL